MSPAANLVSWIGLMTFDATGECYARYYNEIRTHLALNKDAPRSRAMQTGAV